MKLITKYLVFLFFYHLVFVIISYQYVLKNSGDSFLYWWQKPSIDSYNYWTLQNFGTKLIMQLNYPLVKAGIPVFVGFIIYAIIGFTGIFYLYKTLKSLSNSNEFINKYYILELFFLLPNLHFWTTIIGKEPIVFTALAIGLYSFVQKKYVALGVCLLIVAIIRPHVFLMLVISAMFFVLFTNHFSLKKKIVSLGIFVLVTTIFIYIVLSTTKIKYFDVERIVKFNDFSILSFKHAASYVPMLDYNWFYKCFSFLFRPFLYDINSFYSFCFGIENSIQFVIFLVGIISLFYIKKSKYYGFALFFLIFTLVCTFFYVQRYACFGIFMRTKIMFQPFLDGFFLLAISNWIHEKRKTF